MEEQEILDLKEVIVAQALDIAIYRREIRELREVNEQLRGSNEYLSNTLDKEKESQMRELQEYRMIDKMQSAITNARDEQEQPVAVVDPENEPPDIEQN